MIFIDSSNNEYEPTRWLTFNDVLLKPQRSRFKSRNDEEISLNTSLGEGLSLDIPIISSNMDTVTGKDMASAMFRLGGLGILHRFYKSPTELAGEIDEVYKLCSRVAFSVGCGDKWVEFVRNLARDYQPTEASQMIVCLDVAHGHMEQSIETVEALSQIENVFVIAGNVATGDGAADLADAGAKCIKVGVGPGSVCTTRVVTGHGVPQLSAIMSVRKGLNKGGNSKVGIIADGGIRTSGDIVKAIAAGANAVMLGHMLAGCDETPGPVLSTKDGNVKMYRGQSSNNFLKDIGKVGVSPEGEHISLRAKGPVANVVENILGGIRSGLTYSGVGNFEELRENAEFMEISNHSWIESTPHALA